MVPIAAIVDSVVVELPTGRTAEAVATIESCELNLGAERCRSSEEAGPQPHWYAIVTWRDEQQLQAHVELHRTTRAGALENVREIAFSNADSLEQRYRAIGLLIAFYVVAGRSQQPEEPQPNVQQPNVQQPPAILPLRPAPSQDHDVAWGLDLSGLVGSGPLVNQLRAGGVLRGWVAPFVVPVRPLFSLNWAAASGMADAIWLEGSVGAALRLEPFRAPLGLEVRVEALAQRLSLSAERGDRSDRDWLTRFGARTGLDVVLELTTGFALVVGGQGSLVTPEYSVEVEAQPAGGEHVPAWDVLGGARFWR